MLVPVSLNPFTRHVALNRNPKLIKGKDSANGDYTKYNNRR